MATDLLLIVAITLISFAAKSYSSTVSLVFENLFIKFFRSLRPSYIASFARSTLLSFLSLRNQAISFSGLSFLNSGIIPNFQALGLVLGSYLGLSLSLLYLNIYQTPLKFVLVVLALLFGVFSNRQRAVQLSKMFFFAAMLLFGFELLMFSLTAQSSIIAQLEIMLAVNSISVLVLTLILYFLFRNSFAVLAVLYAFYLKGFIADHQVINSILSVMVYNAFWYMYGTRNAHRETRAICYGIVLITFLTGVLTISLELLVPDLFLQRSQTSLSFVANSVILSLAIGLIGYILSLKIDEFTDKFFPQTESKDVRQIQIFTSKNHYPITYLVEFFEQEYKKLFAMINSMQTLIVGEWASSEETHHAKIEKYSKISSRIMVEMEELEIQISQSERTYKQAQKIFKVRERLSGLKTFAQSLSDIYQLKLKLASLSNVKLRENKMIFVVPLQKIQEFCEYIFSQYIESDVEDVQKVTTLLGELSESLAHFRANLVDLKNSKDLSKEEIELTFEFVSQLQLINLAIKKIAS